MPVAQEFSVEAAHFPITDFLGTGTYAPARFGGAGRRLCGVAQRENADAMFGGRERQFPACHQIEDFRCVPWLDDNGADAGAGKRLRASAQSRRRSWHFHDHQASRIKAEIGNTAAEKVTGFERSKILLHQEQPFFIAGYPAGKRKREAAGRRCITCAGGKNFVQSAAS